MIVNGTDAIFHCPWVLIPNQVRAEGGREIERFRGLENPKDTPNGAEAWIGSVISANGATTENPYLGRSEVSLPNGEKTYLFHAIAQAPNDILGDRHIEHFGENLGILLKMLDAKAPFLLQCHPTRKDAQALWNSQYGKTECWHVLSVRKDMPHAPYILLGFKPGITRERFAERFYAGDIEALEAMCHRIEVKAGETYFIPGGMPHALGSGCFVAEVQEPSDLTAVPITQSELIAFRQKANPAGVFLPIDDAEYDKRTLGSFDYTGYTLEEVLRMTLSENKVMCEGDWGCEKALIDRTYTDYFSCVKIEAVGSAPVETNGEIAIGLVVEGKGELTCDGNIRIPIHKGMEIFFPFDVPNSKLCGNVSMLLCQPTVAN